MHTDALPAVPPLLAIAAPRNPKLVRLLYCICVTAATVAWQHLSATVRVITVQWAVLATRAPNLAMDGWGCVLRTHHQV